MINSDIFNILYRPEVREAITKYVEEHDVLIADTDISTRGKNYFADKGLTKLSEIIFISYEEIKAVPRLGVGVCDSFIEAVKYYLAANESAIWDEIPAKVRERLDDEEFAKAIIGICDESQFAGLSAREVCEKLNAYYSDEEFGLKLDIPLERVEKILDSLCASGNDGSKGMNSQTKADEASDNSRNLALAGSLKKKHGRYFKNYLKFREFVQETDCITERIKDVFLFRLQGMTYEEIAEKIAEKWGEKPLTRQRICSILSKYSEKLKKEYDLLSEGSLFYDDFYAYLYDNYAFDIKRAVKLAGIPMDSLMYLDIYGHKQGENDILDALEDEKINPKLLPKVMAYLKHRYVEIDGAWIRKKSADLEKAYVERFCREDVKFDDFVAGFNSFLRGLGIEEDSRLYIRQGKANGSDKDGYRSTKNIVGGSRFVLWKLGQMLRYYDIDAYDYQELFDTINIANIKNTVLSTQKFVRDFPELMKKYDIRDEYELHNLLKKIVPEGSYHDFKCGRMPYIIFGDTTLEDVVLSVISNNSPIRNMDLIDILYEDYGFKKESMNGRSFGEIDNYCHNGVYSTAQKEMPEDRREKLRAALTEDFYYIDEIKQIYAGLFLSGSAGATDEAAGLAAAEGFSYGNGSAESAAAEGFSYGKGSAESAAAEGFSYGDGSAAENEPASQVDLDEVNVRNLKNMGYTVYSTCVLTKTKKLDEYFENLFSMNDEVDLEQYKDRYAGLQSYWSVILSMKKRLKVFEYKKNHLMKMEKFCQKYDVTIEDMKDFGDKVYEYVNCGECFSIFSIRRNGFRHPLFDVNGLGLSDVVLENILKLDERFTFASVFNRIIFSKGAEIVTVKKFVKGLVMAELKDKPYLELGRLNRTLMDDYCCMLDGEDDKKIVYLLAEEDIYFAKSIDSFFESFGAYYDYSAELLDEDEDAY